MEFGRFLITASFLGAFMLVVSAETVKPPAHHRDGIFSLGDKNNDSILSLPECTQVWSTFDVDSDDMISKIEFLFRWRFSNLNDAKHAPLFFRLIDVDFDGSISKSEIEKLCKFFDDDEDGRISMFEYDLTWEGLFNFIRTDSDLL
ncbi:uncharacterized protein LOC106012025 [Aplysia californica]|uniref:Uncharacterized protein LOC106012025 n=1 Tax=Aplysia californica TaxID=6500 RepID=A0ABM1A1S3_APLCA|nr:uncharacterized protein LOC106012025 [Aplysia californica]